MAPTRARLREHLVRTRIAGAVATPRQNNLGHYRKLADRDPYYMLGLDLKPSWTRGEVLRVMVERCGVVSDPTYRRGADTIDPELTIDALEAMGERVGQAARRGATVVLATGHPATLTGIYQALARGLRASGCRLLTPAKGWVYQTDAARGSETRRIVYAPEGVAMVEGDDGHPQHTHDAAPMEAMLAELAPRSAGTTSEASSGAEPDGWPDLAIADHGWAGAAGQAGIDTVGFADCNDPALFVGAAEGKIDVVVPLDDGISPHHYEPLTAYLLRCAGLD
jgi:Phosphatase